MKNCKTEAGKELYKMLKKCQDEDSIKKTALNYMINFRKRAIEDFDLKNSIINQIPRFYAEDSLEFNQFFPDFTLSNNMSQNEINHIFEDPENLENEEGNTFLLKKMKKIMNSNIINHWKYLQDTHKL